MNLIEALKYSFDSVFRVGSAQAPGGSASRR